MAISEIMNWILGGSSLAMLIGLLTLRSTLRKAEAEAERARGESETVKITNAESATRILVENIVKPLKEELNATRKDLQATKREMARLRKAVEAATNCPYSDGRDGCPVIRRLQEQPRGVRGEVDDGYGAGGSPGDRQGGHRNKADPEA